MIVTTAAVCLPTYLLSNLTLEHKRIGGISFISFLNAVQLFGETTGYATAAIGGNMNHFLCSTRSHIFWLRSRRSPLHKQSGG